MKKITVLFLILLIFLFVYLFKKIGTNYIDYAEGSYLYEALLVKNGQIPYRQVFLPQPPLIFLIGSIFLKISHSIIFIRGINLFLYFLTSYFFYLIIQKVYKNDWLALICGLFIFFLSVSIYRFQTFTAETYQRPILFLFIYLLVSSKKLVGKKLGLLSSIFSILLLFIKYSSIPLLIVFGFYLFLRDKKIFYNYLFYFSVLMCLILLIIFTLFGSKFFINTFLIRYNIPLKPRFEIAINSWNLFFNWGFLIILNLILGIYYLLKEKNLNKALLLLLPVFYLVNFLTTFFEGTYGYVNYTIEPLLILGFFSFLFNLHKRLNINIPVIKYFIYIIFFLSIFQVVFIIQTFNYNWQTVTNLHDILVTNSIVSDIQKYSATNKEILVPPYFAYLADRKITENFYDPFMFLMVYTNQKTYLSSTVQNYLAKIVYKLEKREIPVVVADWRILKFKPLSDALEKNYRLIKKSDFSLNDTESVDIYLPN